MIHIRSGGFAMALPVNRNRGNRGFTLVELMVAMAAGAIVLAAVMTSFLSQHKSYLVQDDVVEMQQNARVAMDMLTREIRGAGFDPSGKANAGIITATAGRLGFTQDLNNNGVIDLGEEAITYGFSSVDDADFDGIVKPDGVGAPLGRNIDSATGSGVSGFKPVAENFRAIEFYYLMADGTRTPTPAVLKDIRSIQVSILVQTSKAYENGPPAQKYRTPGDVDWSTTPGFRSRYLTTTVQCRNLGL